MELITEVQNETVVNVFLLLVWVILGITWLAVHILVSIFSILHGLWKLFFTWIAILAVAFGMYQNVILLEYATRKIGGVLLHKEAI